MTVLTEIAKENYLYYAPLLPPFVMEEVQSGENVLIFGFENDEEAAGAAAVRFSGSLAEILWFYLDDGFRGMGIGTESFFLMLQHLRYEYDIVEIFMELQADADPGLFRLFEGLDVRYRDLSECRFETSVGWMRSSEKLKPVSKDCIALSELSDKELRNFCDTLIKNRMALVPMPIVKEHYLPDVSAVYMKDGVPSGILLLKKNGEDMEIPYMAALNKDPLAMIEMMRFVREKTARFQDAARLSMNLVDGRLKDLVKTLLDMDEDDEDGFVHNRMAYLSLDFLEETVQKTELTLTLWEELNRELAYGL